MNDINNNNKLLTIFLTLTPDKCENTKMLLNLIKSGREKKYEIIIFASGDGVYNFIDFGKEDMKHKNLSEQLKKLINDGLKVKICNACIITREIKEQLLMPQTEVTGIAELFYLMQQSDCFIKMGC
ncbi:MAG: DsrE family protein [Armatimonadetes bacterium]|nr:DsrE family protein [Armatimonadota bacterium]